MTDLLQRYLSSVERRLPKEAAADIVAELREALSAKIEAKEAALGRPASADDVAAVLKAYGHPVVVASRYSGNDYVIGPTYYPWFWHVQRIAVGAAIAIAFGIVAVRALGSDEPFTAVMRGVGGAVQAALITFGVVTALFVGAERTKLDLKWVDKWDPRTLPRDNIREPKSLIETAFTLLFDLIFLLWWVKVVQWPAEIPVKGDGAVGVHFSPAWAVVYWPILILIVGVTVVHLIDLFRPAWSRWRSTLSIIGHAGGLVVLWVLFQSRPLVDVVPLNGADAANVEKVRYLADNITLVSLGVAGVIWAVTIGVEVWRQVQASRPPAPRANGLAA